MPALQGGIDYADPLGFYVGYWTSTIRWVDRPDVSIQNHNFLEQDFYGGYRTTFGDFGLDVGAIRYYYQGDFKASAATPVTANTTEVYVGGTWKIVSLKYNYVVSKNIFAWGDTTSSTKSEGSGYTDLTVTYPFDETVNLIAHLGHQTIRNDSDASYSDVKLGVTKDYGIGVVGLTFTDTDAKGKYPSEAYRWNGQDTGKAVLALSFTKTF